MTKLSDLIACLHKVAPQHFQEDYDNAGLITGHPDMNVNGVLVCLDAVEAVVDEAIELKCNVIVAHHPIVFKGLKRFNGSNYVERTIIKAIKNDIAIFAIHTNLDNVYDSGVNAKIAEKIGLVNTAILSPKTDIFYNDRQVGSGMTGDLPTPLKPIEFLSLLRERMELKVIKHTALCKTMISKLAVCGGSGSFLLPQAIRSGADVFITSDFKYHEFFNADSNIIIADIGHYESEKYTIELLYALIINKFSNFATHCTKIITNPVNYYQ